MFEMHQSIWDVYNRKKYAYNIVFNSIDQILHAHIYSERYESTGRRKSMLKRNYANETTGKVNDDFTE